MNARIKRIGVLGGSFDPVHNGHLSIAKSFLQSDLIDELWILLTPNPPHKTDQALADYSHRLAMLRIAFEDFKNVRISDIEAHLPQPSYTIQTLKYLKQKYHDCEFYLCIGGDSLRDFTDWKNWEEIITLSELIVAQRPATKNSIPDNKLLGKIHFVDHEPVAISSTEIRERIKKGEDISEFVPKSILDIIQRKNLYREE